MGVEVFNTTLPSIANLSYYGLHKSYREKVKCFLLLSDVFDPLPSSRIIVSYYSKLTVYLITAMYNCNADSPTEEAVDSVLGHTEKVVEKLNLEVSCFLKTGIYVCFSTRLESASRADYTRKRY